MDELRGRTKLKGKPTPEQLEELQGVKEELRSAEEALAAAEEERDRLALRVPNAPHDDVPDGSSDEDAAEVRRIGEPTAGEAREHTEVGRFDMERAARMSGARFGYWIGDTARLSLALYRFALDRLAEKGFISVLPPVLVREEALDRHRRVPVRRAERLRAARRRPVPRRHRRDPAREPPRRRDPGGRRAPAPLRRLLGVLPARGRGGRP